MDAFVEKFNPVGGTASQPHNENDLVYSTLLGGSGSDMVYGMAIDTDGHVYITGRTEGPYTGVVTVPRKDFPLVNAYQTLANCNNTSDTDAFVAKLSASGSSLVYSTYLGGSQADEGKGIAVDNAGNAYITGYTASFWRSDGFIRFPIDPQNACSPDTDSVLQPKFPGLQTVSGRGGKDAFLTKMTPSGSVIYSSYVGQSWSDSAEGLARDPFGNVYLVGQTQSGPGLFVKRR